MFVCKNCHTQISSNTPSYLYPIKKRSKTYPKRPSANRFLKDGRAKQSDDPGGVGWEIEKEIIVCADCYQQLSSDQSPM